MPLPLPSTPAQLTAAILVANALLLGLYSAAARTLWGADATVSVVVGAACRREPILPFALGVVVGHWLWSLR